MLAFSFNIVVDRAIGVPGHGKDIIDRLNAVMKCFLQKQFCMTGTPEVDSYGKWIKAYLMVEKASTSLAKECQWLCMAEDHINGAKRHEKMPNKKEMLRSINESLPCFRSKPSWRPRPQV